jgi:hypothetical protein
MAEYIGQILYIKPNCIVSVPEFDTPKNYFSAGRIANNRNLLQNKHNSKLSDKAIKRIKSAINWLVASAKEKKVYNAATKKHYNFKVNLITLTLPDTSVKINEHAFKTKLMHPFFMYMKKYYKLNNYVWKIEFQNNGKLHVHITTDSFISHHVIRSTWNRLLKNNNYLIEFEKKFKHDNPNSIDVHAVWKVKNLGAYLAKYMSKNEQNTEIINGRIWGCSHELSDKNKCVLGVDRNECHEVLRPLMNPNIEYKEIVSQDATTGKIYRNAELFFIKLEHWHSIIHGKIKEAYDLHRFHIRNGIPKLNNSLSI